MMRIGWRRAVVAIGAVAVLVALYLVWFDRPIPIQFYRQIDDRTIALYVDDGSAWNRVQSVVETDRTVTVTIRSLIIPTLPAQAGVARNSEVRLTLEKPLGSRPVIDGSSTLPLEPSCRPWIDGCPTMPPAP